VLVPVVLVPVVVVGLAVVPVEVPVVDVPVEDDPVEEVEADKPESIYISRRFPAPQYSKALPGQMNEQSLCVVARTEPALMVLPQ
jgi:hypothetical protein